MFGVLNRVLKVEFLTLLLTASLTSASWAASTPIARVSEPLRGRDLLQISPVEVDPAQAKRGTVILFLSSRCPCSASHEEKLRSLFQTFSKDGFQFVAFHSNQDETATEAKVHFKNANLPFPVLDDPKAKVANQFGALKTPHAYVLNTSGEVIYQGGVDDSHVAQTAKRFYLEAALKQVSAGQRPNPSEVRVLGCVIQRSSE